MSAPGKFDPVTRERAVRMYEDRVREFEDSKLSARRHVGELLDINPATLRNWVEQVEIPTGAGVSDLGGGRTMEAEVRADDC